MSMTSMPSLTKPIRFETTFTGATNKDSLQRITWINVKFQKPMKVGSSTKILNETFRAVVPKVQQISNQKLQIETVITPDYPLSHNNTYFSVPENYASTFDLSAHFLKVDLASLVVSQEDVPIRILKTARIKSGKNYRIKIENNEEGLQARIVKIVKKKSSKNEPKVETPFQEHKSQSMKELKELGEGMMRDGEQTLKIVQSLLPSGHPLAFFSKSMISFSEGVRIAMQPNIQLDSKSAKELKALYESAVKNLTIERINYKNALDAQIEIPSALQKKQNVLIEVLVIGYALSRKGIIMPEMK